MRLHGHCLKRRATSEWCPVNEAARLHHKGDSQNCKGQNSLRSISTLVFPVIYKILNHKFYLKSSGWLVHRGLLQNTANFIFVLLAFFITKDNGDKAMHLSTHKSKRRKI